MAQLPSHGSDRSQLADKSDLRWPAHARLRLRRWPRRPRPSSPCLRAQGLAWRVPACKIFVDLDDMYDTVGYSAYTKADLDEWMAEETGAFLSGRP